MHPLPLHASIIPKAAPALSSCPRSSLCLGVLISACSHRWRPFSSLRSCLKCYCSRKVFPNPKWMQPQVTHVILHIWMPHTELASVIPDTFLDKIFLVFDPLLGCKIHEDRDFPISVMIIFQNTKQSLACSRNICWMKECMHACMLQQVQWCL